jgi:hypothetical protein
VYSPEGKYEKLLEVRVKFPVYPKPGVQYPRIPELPGQLIDGSIGELMQ